MNIRTTCARTRGLALFAVLVVVVLASLAGTTAIVVSTADRARAAHALNAAEARAAAESALDAILQELGAQRTEALAGSTPTVIPSRTLRVRPDGSRVVYRLVELTDRPGEHLRAENARLDINTVPREALERLDALTPGAIDAILAARARAPIEDLADLARLAGIDESDLQPDLVGTDRETIASLLTTTAFDPALAAGAGDGGERRIGQDRLRVRSNADLSFQQELTERIGEQPAGSIVQTLEANPPSSHTDLVRRVLERSVSVSLPELALALDTLAVEDVLVGRVDLNRASAQVLAALPGLDLATAEAITSARDALDERTRASILWPVTEGLISVTDYAEAAPWLTVRSMQWRVRIEAGIAPAPAAATGPTIGGPGPMDSAAARIAGPGGADIYDGPLRARVVLEAVVDLTAERPRLAVLTDLTELHAARLVRRVARDDEFTFDRAPGVQAPTGRETFDNRRWADRSWRDRASAPGVAEPERAPGDVGVRHGRWSPARSGAGSGGAN